MSEKLWCAACGKWSDHRSGACPTLPRTLPSSEPQGGSERSRLATCSAAWTDALRVGDSVTVRPYWNDTTRADKIATPTKVLGIQRGTRSQSGVLIRVATALRDDAWLDAAWFKPNSDSQTQSRISNSVS